MYKKRLEKLKSLLESKQLDNLIVTDMENVYYLSGFTGSAAVLIVNCNKSFLLVDSRYTIQAGNECKDFDITEYRAKTSSQAIKELLNNLHISRIGFEADNLTFEYYSKLNELVSGSVVLIPTSGLIVSLRVIKDDYEIATIKEAAIIANKTFALVKDNISTGMTERDAAILINSTMQKLGAEKECFDTIAAYGNNAACPHHSPTNEIIKSGSMLKMDFGPKYKNYTADITRTIFIGKPTCKFEQIYEIVFNAQQKAIEAIKPGIAGKDIDKVAREYINSKGYGENFGHGLGHMLGINVHDGPAFSQTSEVVLMPGMVATIEPGIYINGWGGIRLEEDIIVTEHGYEVITGKH